MKKVRFKSLNFRVLTGCLAFLYIAVIINSCRKDNANASTTDTAVSAAKQWYESAYPVTHLSRSLSRVNTATANNTHSLDFSGLIKPDWSHAATYSRFGKQVVELPIDPASDKISGSLKMGAGGAIIYDKNNSHTSFLLLNDGKNYQAFIMTFIADTSYLKNDHSKLTNNTYRHTDKNITGVLLYFTPKGQFVSGWFYKNGIIVRNIQGNLNAVNNAMGSRVRNLASGPSLNAPNVGKPKTRDLVCTNWYADYYFNGQFWYSEYLGTTCYDPTIPMINGDGGGGSGGGFAAPGGSTDVTVNDTTKVNVDPCPQKAQLNATATDPTVAAQNKQLFNDVKTSNLEHGFIQNLVNPTIGSSYYTTPELIATSALPDQLTPPFYWDSNNGYTIGVTHDHPDGSGPSPADIFYMLINSQSSTLTNAGLTDVVFYMNNASVTVVTNTNNYVVTVKDWNNLQTLYNTYIADPKSFNKSVSDNSALYGSYEAAILSTFGSAINLYTDGGLTNYYPLTLNTTGPVPRSAEVPCP
jgi:hypothetical protein